MLYLIISINLNRDGENMEPLTQANHKIYAIKTDQPNRTDYLNKTDQLI